MHFKRYGSVAGRIGLTLVVTGSVLAATATPSFAAAATLTLSSTTGPLAGTNTITAVTADNSKPFTSAGVVNVELQLGTACAQTYATVSGVTGLGGTVAAPIVGVGIGTAGGSVTVITPSKIAIKIPTVLSVAGKYMVCVYSGVLVTAAGPPAVVGSPLTASGTYSVAAAAVITTVAPNTGPAQGGTLVTVTGTSLPSTTGSPLSVSIGGVAATTVTMGSAGSFTFVAPPHAAGGPYAVSITTAGGTVNTTLTNQFTYSNGISVLPATAQSVADVATAPDVTLDVLGVGFSSLVFNAADTGAADAIPDLANAVGNEAKAKVYLVQGLYLSTIGTPDLSGKDNGEVTNCNGVIVISDTELLCTLHITNGGAASTPLVDGTYTVAVVGDGSAAAAPVTAARTPSIISSGATFTISPYL